MSLRYQTGEVALPIAAELVVKTVPMFNARRSKPVTGALLPKTSTCSRCCAWPYRGVAQQQVAYRYLLAGSWYASAENMHLERALGHHFVFALESSRTGALSAAARAQCQFQAVQSLMVPDTQPCASVCGPSKRRCSSADKSLPTRMVARARYSWSAATPT